MKWLIAENEAGAGSAFHGGGSPFLYHFRRTEGGWLNETDPEIINTPTLQVFATLDAARGWAERNEASMNAIHDKRASQHQRKENGHAG